MLRRGREPERKRNGNPGRRQGQIPRHAHRKGREEGKNREILIAARRTEQPVRGGEAGSSDSGIDVHQWRRIRLRDDCASQHTTSEPPRAVNKLMGDPRNVAHAKRVSQEKHHKDKHASTAGSVPSQRGKNVQTKKKAASAAESTAPKAETAKPTQPVEPTQLEKSLVVLSKLKELEFHSRANIEKLAELNLTIEEELKQKA